jgi:formamidopyrimidine-DNA glycosylase
VPELPEVQTVVDTLRPRVVGRTIARICLNRRDILTPSDANLAKYLTRRRIRDISRRGKRIVFTLDTAERFYIHLGMTGQLTVQSISAPHAPHTHFRLQLDAGDDLELRFVDPRRFGGIWWLGNAAGDDQMGPEPLQTRPKQLARRLSRTTRAIKNALLDQGVVAGLGNIYVDESLFTAGIHPLIAADELTNEQVARLSRAIKSTLRKALRHRGSTLRNYRDANGDAGSFQNLHRVYSREGEPCRKCKTPIERIVLGGRSTHFCPKCQPLIPDASR